MRRIAGIAVAAGGLVIASGCATNASVGHARTVSGQYFDSVGITGHGDTLTIERGSKVPKLSIIGDNSNVTVEDGAHVGRIELWGNGNTISLPGNLVVYVTQVGTNTIIHRPQQSAPKE
jgi:hypothetical protein